MRGEAARFHGYYTQAVMDYAQAIHLNPTDPIPYLQRSASYFDLGQYTHSFEDFRHYATQIEKKGDSVPLSHPEFTLGFVKGLPKGVYESGKGVMLFLADCITHPIHTSRQMYEALSTLATLVRTDEWKVLGEVLAPEIYQLMTQWDALPSDKRGELAGYAFGKLGADIKEIGCLLKDHAKQAKQDADHPKKGDSADFNSGYLMAYHQVIAIMKNQASFFDLEQEDIGLADIEPERDLL